MKNRVKIPKLLFFQEGPGVRNYQYTTEGVKLLNVANLVNGNLDLSTSERYISEEEAYGKYKHFLCDEGDLIIASSGIKVDYFDKKMGFVKPEHLPLCMNTSTIRFKSLDREVLDINYFMYFLKSQAFKKQLARQITGSAQLNFGPSHLSKMSFSLIDMEDQINIVKQLGKIELIIEMKTKQIQEYDQLIKSRFVEMFGNPIKNDKEWKLKFLDEVCDVRDGTHDSPKYYNVGYPLITSKNISNGNIDYSTAQLICEEDYQNINKRSKVDNGEIFNAVLVSLAYGCNDVKEIVKTTIAHYIPKKSEYYTVVKYSLDVCEQEKDWEAAWTKIIDKYKQYNWIHAYPNAAAEVVSLWFGNNDFDETMHVCAMIGYDVDCNAAQIGTLFGIIGKEKALKEKWTKPIGDELKTYIRANKSISIKELAKFTVKLAKTIA
jgi:restriction endonuclease S subunit